MNEDLEEAFKLLNNIKPDNIRVVSLGGKEYYEIDNNYKPARVKEIKGEE